LKKQIEQLRKAGQMQQANQLEEQLAKLAAQTPQMRKLQELAQKLGQCSKCLRNGKPGDAAKAIAQMQSDLQGELKEMEMLDEAEKQLCQAKDQMGCCKCGGAGCEECQGPPGNGLGRGKGIGPGPEKKTNTALYDSRVKQKVGKGTAIVEGMTEGPNVKGDVQQQIQEQVESTKRGTTDPLTGRQMPRKHGEHAKEYFDGLRGN
jgi:arsenate reductase-like glutaredoxin family protein